MLHVVKDEPSRAELVERVLARGFVGIAREGEKQVLMSMWDLAGQPQYAAGLQPYIVPGSLYLLTVPAFDVASTSRGWPPRDVRVAVSRASDVVAWAASQTFPVVWIVKPREGSYLSRGMHVVTMSRRDVATPAALDAWVLDRVVDRDCRRPAARRGPECDRRKNVTFQRYVHRTALVRGRKFDVRVWVLVTSVDPLRLYVLRHGYPKIASRAYTGTRDLGDQCRHVRLMLDPACVRGAGEFLANFPDGYPKSTASPVFHDGFELVRGHAPPPLPGNATATAPGARARWVDAEHFWQATVWPNVERALTAALLLARRDLLRAKAAHERADPAAAGLRRFALLAPDLAVDRRGRVYVEEINANGKIMGTHGRAGGYRDLFHDDGYVRAFLRIVGVDAFPEKKRYGGALAAALDHFCAAAGGSCAPGDRADLEAAVDEEAHAGPHWYRLYPPTRCVAARPRCRASGDALKTVQGLRELAKSLRDAVAADNAQIYRETVPPWSDRDAVPRPKGARLAKATLPDARLIGAPGTKPSAIVTAADKAAEQLFGEERPLRRAPLVLRCAFLRSAATGHLGRSRALRRGARGTQMGRFQVRFHAAIALLAGQLWLFARRLDSH